MCRELLSVGVWRESRWKDPEEKYVLWEQVRKGIRIHLLEGRGERIKKQNSFFFSLIFFVSVREVWQWEKCWTLAVAK